MTNSIYLTTVEPYSGKSLVSLGITELLLRRTPKVGIFRPVIEVPPDKGCDKNIELLIQYYNLDIDYSSQPQSPDPPVGQPQAASKS